MKHTQIHRCKRAQCLELKQRNPRLFIIFAQVTAILYLAGFLTKYVATINCSHLTEERPNGKVSCVRKSHCRRKSSGKIENVEKEGTLRAESPSIFLDKSALGRWKETARWVERG